MIPQAICSRYGLAVGANLVWLVRILMVVCYPVAWPIGKVNFHITCKEIGILYMFSFVFDLIDCNYFTTFRFLTGRLAIMTLHSLGVLS